MLRSQKGVPAAFAIISILYFIFTISSGSSRMIGDDGGDPGSRLLPLVLAAGMFILSVYLFLKEKPVKDEPLSADEKKLFLLSICSCILYVALYRRAGFILTSVLLLFTLTFSYSMGRVSFKDAKYALGGVLLAVIFMLALYSAGRSLTRFLFQTARGTGLLWLNAAFTVFAANVLVLTALFLLIKKIVWRVLAKGIRENAALKTVLVGVFTSVAAVELLLLIFRQLFLVNLARGVIYW